MSDWKKHLGINKSIGDRINALCKPLTDMLGVTHFGYSRIHRDGRLNWLNSDSSNDAHYFENELYNVAQYLCAPDLIQEGLHFVKAQAMPDWSSELAQFYQQQLRSEACVFFAHHRADYVELYSFHSDQDNLTKADHPLQQTALLQAFVRHFDDKFTEVKQRLAPHAIDIHGLKGQRFHKAPEPAKAPSASPNAEFLRQLGVEKRFPGFFRLSRREQEVLERLGVRWPQQMIADDLYLSLRTVEHYIATIRCKLDITAKEELVLAGKLVRAYTGRGPMER